MHTRKQRFDMEEHFKGKNIIIGTYDKIIIFIHLF